jgi:serine phosphatase RsbU (regulator of sigma subunit)/tetratricopeptide (TPR) repeat protein
MRLNTMTRRTNQWIAACLLLLIGTFADSVQAQDNNLPDSARINKLISQATSSLREHNTDKAIASAKEGLWFANKISYLRGEATANQVLADASLQKKSYDEALKYYFSAVKAFDILKDDRQVIVTYTSIGMLYQEQVAYRQALKYFELANKKSDDSKQDEYNHTALLKNSAYCSEQLEEYTQAIQYKTELLTLYKQQNNKVKITETYRELSSLCEQTKQYKQAEKYNSEMAKVYSQSNDLAGLSSAYNNLGFIYKRTGDMKSSADYFNKVTELIDKQPRNLTEQNKAVLYQNVGVAYTNLKQYVKAKEDYIVAFKIWERRKNEKEMASANNYLASNYYVSGNTSRALKAVTDAIKLGEENHAEEVLVTSYKILSLIYEKDNNDSKAQAYQEKYKALRDKLAKAEKERKQQLLQREAAIEKSENDIRLLLAEQEREAIESERKDHELNMQQNEIALKAKELLILKRDQELKAIEYRNQLLEKERTEQALALTQQQLEAEKRDRQLGMLAKEHELQEQKLKQKVLEDEKQKKAIQLLEADKKLKDEQLKNSYWLFALFTLVLAIIAYSLIQKRKANIQLKKQQHEIKEKNEALTQNMEELRATQEVLSEQKEQLEVQHQKITHSIRYAHRIQQSILPSPGSLTKMFPEHFVTYFPKDIVSGDFYWATEKDNKKILSVADCTGHGVPGALMSMVGSNTLSELVNEKSFTDPARILNNLHESIRAKLSQEESQNHDGMDLGICVLESGEGDTTKVVFAGAKQTLFVVKNGELVELEGDRKSIGGANAGVTRDFSNREVELQKGDVLYLTTDGFIDQNSPHRMRFNKKRFKKLITEVYSKDTREQKRLFEEALADHQQNAEQRDDITVIAVKI